MAKPVKMIVACAENRVIGRDGGLPWNLPEDSRYFLDMTVGGVLVIGRVVFEEMQGMGEVNGTRTMVVVSRDKSLAMPGVHVVSSVREGVELAQDLEGDIWIAGGQKIYEDGLEITDLLYLTLVHAKVEGDRYFPEWREQFTRVVSARKSEQNGYRFTYFVLAPSER